MKAKFLMVAAVVIAAGFALNCTATVGQGLAPSTTPLTGMAPHSLGRGTGEACYMLWVHLIASPPGKPDADEAIQKATAEAGGDSLINVRAYTKVTDYFIVQKICTIVEGDVVKTGLGAAAAPAVAPVAAPAAAPAAPAKPAAAPAKSAPKK